MHSKRHIFLISLLTLCSIGSSALHAETLPLDAHDEIDYNKQGTYGSGWVNITPPTGGQYIYEPELHKGIKSDKAFMVGKPSRQDFEFLTEQEQEGVWKYRNNAQQALMKSEKPVAKLKSTGKHRTKFSHNSCSNPPQKNLSWPKIVVNGTQTCVPLVEYSEASDWKDHLTCTEAVGLYGK